MRAKTVSFERGIDPKRALFGPYPGDIVVDDMKHAYVLTGPALNDDPEYVGVLWLGDFYQGTIQFLGRITDKIYSELKTDLRLATPKELEAVKKQFAKNPDLIDDIKYNWEVTVKL
jgi:hypothetical protein